jgi:hypothetical protein
LANFHLQGAMPRPAAARRRLSSPVAPVAPVALALILSLLAASAAAMPDDALSFDLPLGAQHCFRQSFPPDTPALAEMLVVDGEPGLAVTATVSAIHTNTLVLHRESLSHETADLPPAASGMLSEFKVCIVAQRPRGWVRPQDHDRGLRPGETRRVFVSLRERGGSAGASVARADVMERLTRKAQLEGLENTIDGVSRQVTRLSREIGELRSQEKLLAESGEYTATRILRCSVLACVAIVAAGVLSSLSVQHVLEKNGRYSARLA